MGLLEIQAYWPLYLYGLSIVLWVISLVLGTALVRNDRLSHLSPEVLASIAEKEAAIAAVEENLVALSNMKEPSIVDLGDETVEWVEVAYRDGLLSGEDAEEAMRSIAILQQIIDGSPNMIATTQRHRDKLLAELEALKCPSTPSI